MSSDVKKNVQICQGIDSYDDMVHDATQRFPQLSNVAESMRKVWKKYDLDSYPEFPRSCMRECVDEDCVEGDEVEDEEEDDCDDYNDHYYDYDYEDYEDDEDDEDDGENEDNEDENSATTNDDAGEEVEEQAAEAIEQLLPEFIDSFHILNSSSSLNYIFSPVITLPVPYKKDDAYSECFLRPLCNSGSSARPEDSDI